MKPQDYIMKPFVLIMTLLILAIHVVPTSLYFLDSEICISLNVVDSESEESEKEKEKELSNTYGSFDFLGSKESIFFMCNSVSLPNAPFQETLSPPPDYV